MLDNKEQNMVKRILKNVYVKTPLFIFQIFKAQCITQYWCAKQMHYVKSLNSNDNWPTLTSVIYLKTCFNTYIGKSRIISFL